MNLIDAFNLVSNVTNQIYLILTQFNTTCLIRDKMHTRLQIRKFEKNYLENLRMTAKNGNKNNCTEKQKHIFLAVITQN